MNSGRFENERAVHLGKERYCNKFEVLSSCSDCRVIDRLRPDKAAFIMT